jgi:hypothetical protein
LNLPRHRRAAERIPIAGRSLSSQPFKVAICRGLSTPFRTTKRSLLFHFKKEEQLLLPQNTIINYTKIPVYSKLYIKQKCFEFTFVNRRTQAPSRKRKEPLKYLPTSSFFLSLSLVYLNLRVGLLLVLFNFCRQSSSQSLKISFRFKSYVVCVCLCWPVVHHLSSRRPLYQTNLASSFFFSCPFIILVTTQSSFMIYLVCVLFLSNDYVCLVCCVCVCALND